ncbi:creatininase family protein [Bosea sp. (in: a-proteobacteria)]|uniref:creatininase family protein n=1 Tax=Bosea sp. (in: a-proteobacteria) TaxID=1871050 RepID=UPI002627F003|nr:creatininase family protein [Bosea sp. (in: a-proteobacteria)]MCO5092493.1 creatininase family protein [Bosea sp. (in: a-proteobacteria)]
MTARFWGELKSSDFASLSPARTVAVLPLAAIEQHGPHLPLSVDTTVMDGMLAEAMPLVPAGPDVLVLPTQAIGKSNEHLNAPGTLTIGWDSAIRSWIEIGESVKRAGLRKLVLVTAHGGNVDPMRIAARELRVGHGMLAVTTAWMSFGLPEGLYGELDIRHGIHGGDVETSLMLHFRPDLVDMGKAALFKPLAVTMAEEAYAHLRPTGPHGFAWMAEDVNPAGVAGDARLATAAKGKATAAFQAERFARLMADVARLPLDTLYEAG